MILSLDSMNDHEMVVMKPAAVMSALCSIAAVTEIVSSEVGRGRQSRTSEYSQFELDWPSGRRTASH